MIQQLLAEAGHGNVAANMVAVQAAGAEAAADTSDVKSPETYIGFNRAENVVSPGGAARNEPHGYAVGDPRLNEWGLSGQWTIGGESAALNHKDGSIVYRFHARDPHLVLGPAPESGPIGFRAAIDGAAPGASHGTDIDADAQGFVTGQRLYQLVRQSGEIADHTFEIRFFDSGVQAYAFTFG